MGDAVAEAVLAQWAALPKTGKPQPHEHTVLAGIALELPAGSQGRGSNASSNGSGVMPAHAGASGAASHAQQQTQLAAVAIGTGTKCLGGSKRVPGGAAVNDCHAEALCRRALLRWLYGEMQHAAERGTAATAGGAAPAEAAAAASTAVLRLIPPQGSGAGSSAAQQQPAGRSSDHGIPADAAESAGAAAAELFGGWRFQLQPGVRLHMYVSQPPCGDASILHAGCAGAAGAAACQHGSTVGGGAAADAPAVPAAGGQQGEAAGAATAAGGRGLAASFGRTGAKPLLKRQRLQPAGEEQPGGQPHGGSAEAGPATRQAQQQAQQQQQQQVPTVQAAAQQEQWRLPQQHEVESYGAAQETGVVRRKPGRGDATLSMSCSDKLARWLLLGLQGSLLDGLLAAPLHLSSITVGLPPPPAAGGQAAAEAAGGSTSRSGREDLAAQAAAALHRALVERTAGLATERLPPARQPAAPALHVHSPAAGADGQAAGGSRSSSSRMQALGLAPSAARRVAGGSSVVWVAPPSAAFKWKQQQLPADGAPAVGTAAGAASSSSHGAATTVPVLAGGATEAVACGNGLKIGAAKVKPGQPVPPSAQPSVCKAALFGQWQQLAAALRSLPGSGEPAAAQQVQQQPSSAAGEAAAAAAPDPKRSLAQSLSYRAAKQAAGRAYAAAWRALLRSSSLLEAWIPKPPELEGFAL